MKSLWAPGVRWTEVTEEGFQGGPVMPDNYDGSPEATEQLRANIARSGIVGSLVGNDFKSSMIVVPLLDIDPSTGKRVDYRALSHAIENIRDRVRRPSGAGAHPRDRLRQAGGRPDRRPDAGGAVLRPRGADRRRDHLPLHPLRALARRW